MGRVTQIKRKTRTKKVIKRAANATPRKTRTQKAWF